MCSNVMTILLMGGMFLLMWNKGTLISTRRMAMLPLAVCVVELLTFGLLHGALFPVLTVVLWAARLAILGCCGLKLRHDMIVARRRARRRMLEEKRRSVMDREGCPVTVLARCA
ncbi:MAG: hypothetical protein J6K98_00460 [Clostridia bacterium]|nr:hypothetical protein [Clostridia bacterium]